MNWQEKISSLQEILNSLEFTDNNGNQVAPETAFDQLREFTDKIREEHGTIFAIGNGASASMASHFAADLAKNGQLHTQVFSDLSLITAISNDLGYTEVFAEPLRRSGHEGDLLVAISSSGNSNNILQALDEAKKLAMTTVTLSAMSSDNHLRNAGDLNAYLPAKTFGDAETVHAALLHHWIDLVVK